MEFVNAKKTGVIIDAKKRINKANYIISFKEMDGVFGEVIRGFFIPNKKLLKKVVKDYNIPIDLLIYGFTDGRYTIYKLEWCI